MDEEESFIEKGGIAGYLNRNYKDKTIGKEITPHVQSGLKILGDSYNDAMYQARRGLYGPHALVGAHAIDFAGKIIPDIPLDKAISHGLHNWGGIDKPLADVGGVGGEMFLTRKALKSIPKNLVSTKVTPYTKALNPVNKKKLINITEEAFSSENSLFKKRQIPKYSSGAVVQTKDGPLYRPTPGTMTSIFESTLKSPGEKKREDILSGERAYPSIEEMTLANRPPQNRAYKRPTDLNKKEWSILGLKLQHKHGGSDFERETFIKEQRDNLARLKKDQAELNKQFQFDYLQFALTALEEGLIDGVSSVEDLYGNKVAINNVEDLVHALYLRMAQDPKKAAIFDIGHVRSARVLADEGQEAADYASNLRLEIRRSIRDWNRGKPIKDIVSTGKPPGWKKGDPMIFKHEWKGGKLLEGGNLHRRDLDESPKIVDLMLGTSPNIEIEYQKYLGELGSALDEIVPIELHDEYKSYLRKRWRKWQGWGESKVLGKQQLDLFEKKIGQFTNDFLNKIEEGKAGTKQFQEAKEDAELDIMRDALSGKLGEEEYKAVVRRIARWALEGNREKRNIIDKLFPDEHRP